MKVVKDWLKTKLKITLPTNNSERDKTNRKSNEGEPK